MGVWRSIDIGRSGPRMGGGCVETEILLPSRRDDFYVVALSLSL